MELTENQRYVLEELAYCGHKWVTPMKIGGHDGSFHSAVLGQLVRKGLAESRYLTPGARGSKQYQATDDGRTLAKQLSSEHAQRPSTSQSC